MASCHHPAHGAFLCGAALLKDCPLQGILQHLQIALPVRANAVNGHAFEHQDYRKDKARAVA